MNALAEFQFERNRIVYKSENPGRKRSKIVMGGGEGLDQVGGGSHEVPAPSPSLCPPKELIKLGCLPHNLGLSPLPLSPCVIFLFCSRLQFVESAAVSCLHPVSLREQRSFVLCSQVGRLILRYCLHKHLVGPSCYNRGSFPDYFYNPSVLAPGELACCPLGKGGSGAKSKRSANAWGKKKSPMTGPL